MATDPERSGLERVKEESPQYSPTSPEYSPHSLCPASRPPVIEEESGSSGSAVAAFEERCRRNADYDRQCRRIALEADHRANCCSAYDAVGAYGFPRSTPAMP